MKVIKVVCERGGRLTSTFAPAEWEKEYAKGVETKPDEGYLFAYPRENLGDAEEDVRDGQYWLAEAEVVGNVDYSEINMQCSDWHTFWGHFVLRRRRSAEYLLCSSITLIKELDV